MAEVKPFICWRPSPDLASEVAAAPYDTFSRAEATREVAEHPLSFLRIDKPAALFGDEVGEYDERVYTRAREELDTWFEQGILIPNTDPQQPYYFIYRLTRNGRTQTGIVACVSVADYQSGVIKRHENTRKEKEQDRVKHIQALDAHTGPVFLAYPSLETLDATLKEYADATTPLYDYVAADGVRHELWRVDESSLAENIQSTFASLPTLYIADGHHRAAAAARVAELYESSGSANAKQVEAGSFLAVLFGSDELEILDYNRVISDLAGLESAELLAAVSEVFEVTCKGSEPYKPSERGMLSMYLEGNWYALRIPENLRPDDVAERLDVALLHALLLEPILKIADPRTDPRIAYVGGIRGLKELAGRADKSEGVAFALYPCSLDELFAVADEDRMMPPKSTWFEPKLASGLMIHRINNA